MTTPDMVTRWQAAWESLDPARIEAIYASGAIHMSSVVAERMKCSDGTLRGRAEIRAYAEASTARLKSFKADILSVIADAKDGTGRVSVEYWRILDGDEKRRARVVEILEWENDRVTACRVFHF